MFVINYLVKIEAYFPEVQKLLKMFVLCKNDLLIKLQQKVLRLMSIFLMGKDTREEYFILFEQKNLIYFCRRNLKLQSGKYARLADGCAVATLGDTSVMVTTVSRVESSGSNNFTPLIVDYRQKAAAAGRIPTNFLRRELGPTEHEILTSRLIDRSVRPLFPKKYNYETQIMCNMLAIDGNNDPDVLSINGASAALAVSDIPWNGPVAAVRVGLIDNEFIINPTRREISLSSLNLIISATSQNLIVMVEGTANNILEQDLKKAIKVGLKECQTIVQNIQSLQKLCGKPKRDLIVKDENSQELIDSVVLISETKLKDIFMNYTLDKISRDNAINRLREEVLEKLKEKNPDINPSVIMEIFSETSKNVFRTLIFENNIRYILF